MPDTCADVATRVSTSWKLSPCAGSTATKTNKQQYIQQLHHLHKDTSVQLQFSSACHNLISSSCCFCFFFFFSSPPEQLATSALLLPRGALLLPGHQRGNQSAVPAYRHLHVLLLDVWVTFNPCRGFLSHTESVRFLYLTYIGRFILHVTKPIDHFETKKTSRAQNWK